MCLALLQEDVALLSNDGVAGGSEGESAFFEFTITGFITRFTITSIAITSVTIGRFPVRRSSDLTFAVFGPAVG